MVGTALMALDLEGVVDWVGVDRDLCDFGECVRLLQSLGEVHGIIHLAEPDSRKPVEMTEETLMMNTNILKAAHTCGIDNVLMCLRLQAMATGAGVDNTDPDTEGYFLAKKMCDVMTRAYQRQYGRRYFCIVAPSVYGGGRVSAAGDPVIGAIQQCWRAKQENTSFLVPAGNILQLIWVDDLVRLIAWAYFHYDRVEEPLLCYPPDSCVSASRLAEIVAGCMDYGHALEYDTTTTRPAGNQEVAMAKLPTKPVYFQYTPLKDAIAKMVKGIWA